MRPRPDRVAGGRVADAITATGDRAMRRGISVGGLASAMTLSGLFFLPAGFWILGIQPPGMAKPLAPPPPLSVIQNISELATTRVHISDFIEGESKHWRGRWQLHGEVLMGVNLAEVSYLRCDPEKREAVLRLPAPHLIACKVDHERSDEIYMKSLSYFGFSDPKLLRDEVWRHADRKLQQLGQEPGYLERARLQAERVLQQLFQGAGWKVGFEWEG
jgi:hypothetical protein